MFSVPESRALALDALSQPLFQNVSSFPTVCGSTLVSPILSCPTFTRERKTEIVSSACMEALMQHFQAAGFLEKVFRLAAVSRRSSTNRMYYDRWLRFVGWAAEQGTDLFGPKATQIASFLFSVFKTHSLAPQTVKGYRSCPALVLGRTGKAKLVHGGIISDMKTLMELDRPRSSPVLQESDLGIVLQALGKLPFKALRKAYQTHLTDKKVFLLAMA